jgi:hypothetical protein
MGKTLLQLSEESRAQLAELAEAGMGYFRASAHFPNGSMIRDVVVAGDHYVVPIEAHPDYFTLADLIKGEPFPGTKPPAVAPLRVTVTLSAPAARRIASLPSGWVPAAGAVALLGSTVLSTKTRFYRYTGTSMDHRFSGTHLAVGTYLTTEADKTYANTGFAAVGRYALPIPSPASYVHVYDIPAGTSLLVGTVLPGYGQAGGGVEVKTVSGGSGSSTLGPAAIKIPCPPIDDF